MAEIIEEKEMQESVVRIKQAVQATTTDDTPVAIVTEHEKQVNGDPKKAMTKGSDIYTLDFWYPLSDERYSEYPKVEGKPYRLVTKRFKSDGISANMVLKMQSSSLLLVQTMSKFIEDGKVELPSDDEAIAFVSEIGSERFEDACWLVASTVLGIEEEEKGNIYTINLLNVVGQIINNNPEFFQMD